MPDQRTDTDVIDELISDHQEALKLLDQIPSITDHDQRRDLADTVISEVVRHSVSEEMYVYPAMREYVPDGEQALQHDTQEHQQLEEIMKQLEGVPASEPRFDALVGELTEKLRHHAQDEETEQFPQLRTYAPGEELVKLRERSILPRNSRRPARIRARPTMSCPTSSSAPASGWWTSYATGLTNRAHT